MFICGGAFDGLEKIIEKRLDEKAIGFGANVQSKKEKNVSQLLAQVQPHDILKFGIIPELVGRLPVIAPLNALQREDLVRILQEPKNALVKQYKKLLEYDDVDLEFTEDALNAIADKAIERNIGRPWPPGGHGGPADQGHVRDPLRRDRCESGGHEGMCGRHGGAGADPRSRQDQLFREAEPRQK